MSHIVLKQIGAFFKSKCVTRWSRFVLGVYYFNIDSRLRIHTALNSPQWLVSHYDGIASVSLSLTSVEQDIHHVNT